jgi:hypothetical protein
MFVYNTWRLVWWDTPENPVHFASRCFFVLAYNQLTAGSASWGGHLTSPYLSKLVFKVSILNHHSNKQIDRLIRRAE